jgi:hypothetical protein
VTAVRGPSIVSGRGMIYAHAPRPGGFSGVERRLVRRGWDPWAIPTDAKPGLVFVGNGAGWKRLSESELGRLGLPANAGGDLGELIRHFGAG